MNYNDKLQRSEAVKSFAGSSLGLSPKASTVLARETEKAGDAIEEAIKILEDLRATMDLGEPDSMLSALVRLAGHAGYSNSAATAISELLAAAGAVSGIVSAS